MSFAEMYMSRKMSDMFTDNLKQKVKNEEKTMNISITLCTWVF